MCNNTRNIILRTQSEESLQRHSELSWIFKRPAFLHSCSLAVSKSAAFTLAEVLITLGIIGVVAAITLPALITDINNKIYTARQENISQKVSIAIYNMKSLGLLNTTYPTTDAFVNKLEKYLKIIK